VVVCNVSGEGLGEGAAENAGQRHHVVHSWQQGGPRQGATRDRRRGGNVRSCNTTVMSDEVTGHCLPSNSQTSASARLQDASPTIRP